MGLRNQLLEFDCRNNHSAKLLVRPIDSNQNQIDRTPLNTLPNRSRAAECKGN